MIPIKEDIKALILLGNYLLSYYWFYERCK